MRARARVTWPLVSCVQRVSKGITSPLESQPLIAFCFLSLPELRNGEEKTALLR